ncbi:unnamed protein product [Pleuronectes platessa]|uniref:Uncharacterized protein n=1 Tax=Pleuronectes platessa TaxID=8262 RepID=A0A9N7U6J0_PLEPL|nr:unnamed protein product [Pleuronectes platessa]
MQTRVSLSAELIHGCSCCTHQCAGVNSRCSVSGCSVCRLPLQPQSHAALCTFHTHAPECGSEQAVRSLRVWRINGRKRLAAPQQDALQLQPQTAPLAVGSGEMRSSA